MFVPTPYVAYMYLFHDKSLQTWTIVVYVKVNGRDFMY